MAVPPAYADLGKSAKDIFNKGYGERKQSNKKKQKKQKPSRIIREVI